MIKIFCVIALLIQGCTYAISPDLAKKADKTIQFDQLETDPEIYKGSLVLLGGTIEKSSNIKDGTLIEVSQKPLDRWGKPITAKQSAGRFLVLYPGYLDVVVYRAGRDITVAGSVKGTRQKGPGGSADTYPVIVSKELKLWPDERRSWNRPQHMDPFYDPYASPREY